MYNNQGDRKQYNRQFQEAASFKKATNDTQYFWDLVNRNKNSLQQNKKNNKQEEKILFGKKNESTEKGVIDDSIPVERSGPRSEEVGVLQSFAELEGSVPSYVIENIALMRYERPTPIQKHSVPLGLAGLDLMCCAQTGSGKTFAFLLPVVAALDKILPKTVSESTDPSDTSLNTTVEDSSPVEGVRISIDQRGALPRCIILAPTRELASQIHVDARRLIFNSNLKAVCVYGGNDLRVQLSELSTGCDIIVATPGRLSDLVERGVVSLSEVGFLILDEADRMLDMGFEPQIRRIVLDYDMPRRENRQTFLFSATFPGEIQTLAREFLREYVWIGVGRVGSTVENIKQQIICASANPNEKIKLLLGAIEQTTGRTLVFVQKKLTASWLCNCLNNAYGISAEEIHGDRTQMQRETALRQFRDGFIRILVATDVAARGLDVPAVTHVIQFDMPQSQEDFDVYVHRIGRTGRAGLSGMATSFYVPGRESGEGNGKIAPLILRLLQENKQEIPEWFAALDDIRGGGRSYGGGGGGFKKPYQQNGYGGGGGYNNGSHKFGGRDVRGNQTNTVYGGGTGAAVGAQGAVNAYGDYGQPPPTQQHHAGGYQQQSQGHYGQQQGGGYGGQQGGGGGYGHQQQGQYGRGGGGYGGGNQQMQQRGGYDRGGGYNQHHNGYQQPQLYGAGQQQDQYHGQQQYSQQVHYGQQHGNSYGGRGQGDAVSPVAPHNPYEGANGHAPQGYYDQYGSFVPTQAPGGVVGGPSVDSLGEQFGAMGVSGGNQPPWAVPPPAMGVSRGVHPPQQQKFGGHPQNGGYSEEVDQQAAYQQQQYGNGGYQQQPQGNGYAPYGGGNNSAYRGQNGVPAQNGYGRYDESAAEQQQYGEQGGLEGEAESPVA